ncbi:MAG TPA: HIT family protein [Sphingomicrobium sp.]|nr:HIT family protein [Sphingomicrobium sp.]
MNDPPVNATIEKFGFPATSIREFEHWHVLVRPAQVTLGSLVLAAKSEATAFSELSGQAFAEQAEVIAAIENGLTIFCAYERINYLMLMMVDPHVHFHVIPRYSEAREWGGMSLADRGWPGPPDLKSAVPLSTGQIGDLREELSRHI